MIWSVLNNSSIRSVVRQARYIFFPLVKCYLLWSLPGHIYSEEKCIFALPLKKGQVLQQLQIFSPIDSISLKLGIQEITIVDSISRNIEKERIFIFRANVREIIQAIDRGLKKNGFTYVKFVCVSIWG